MSGYTPGPWEAVFENDERGQPQVIYRGLVCLISHGDRRISVVTDGRNCSTDEWEANARLIAAAPDLLEAVQELLSGHDNLYVAHFGPASNPLNDIAAKAARAAIAKALGDGASSRPLSGGDAVPRNEV